MHEREPARQHSQKVEQWAMLLLSVLSSHTESYNLLQFTLVNFILSRRRFFLLLVSVSSFPVVCTRYAWNYARLSIDFGCLYSFELYLISSSSFTRISLAVAFEWDTREQQKNRSFIKFRVRLRRCRWRWRRRRQQRWEERRKREIETQKIIELIWPFVSVPQKYYFMSTVDSSSNTSYDRIRKQIKYETNMNAKRQEFVFIFLFRSLLLFFSLLPFNVIRLSCLRGRHRCFQSALTFFLLLAAVAGAACNTFSTLRFYTHFVGVLHRLISAISSLDHV